MIRARATPKRHVAPSPAGAADGAGSSTSAESAPDSGRTTTSPTASDFTLLTFPGTEKASKLNTPRGRAGHGVGKLSGPDNVLNSSDDVILVAGGFQALSAQFAPRSKQPGSVGRGTADGLTILEFFDPQTRVFTQVGTVQLAAPRINDPYIMNMGQYNNYTIDGVKGLGNVVLVTHGNTDSAPAANSASASFRQPSAKSRRSLSDTA